MSTLDLRPALLAFLPLAAPALDRSEKLNAPLDLAVTVGDVEDFRVTTDGLWVVYRAQQDSAEPGLYAVRSDRSAGPYRLSEPGASVGAFELVPGALATVFVSGPDLYRAVPGAAPVRLNPPLVAGGAVQEFRVSPGGARVAYRADQDVDEVVELYSVSLAGAPASVRLSPAPVAGGGTVAFRFTPDGTRVLFGGNLLDASRLELFSAPANGSAAAVALCTPIVAGGDVDVHAARVTPDGARAVYVADALVDEKHELFSVPLDGSAGPTRISASIGASNDITDFRIAAAGGGVVYRLAQTRLFAVPADGSAPAISLTGTVSPVYEFELDPAGEDVLFRAGLAGESQVWRVPLDGSASPLQLSDLPSGRNVRAFAFTPDSSRALYVGAHADANTWELFSVPIDASTPPVRLHAPFPTTRSVSAFAFAPDGLSVVFAADPVASPQLFSAPVDGSAPETALHPALPFRLGSKEDFALVGETVVFRSDLGENGVVELHAVALDGGDLRVLNDPLIASPALADVSSFAVAPDGSRVAYTTDTGVFAVELEQPGTALALERGGPSSGIQFRQLRIGAGGRALFVGSWGGEHVFSVPLDGSAPALQLSQGFFPFPHGYPSYQLSPDGSRATFETSTYDGPGATWIARVDGSASAPFSGPSTTSTPVFTAEGERMLYTHRLAPWYKDGATRLYERDADAATPAVEIVPLPSHSIANTFRFELVSDETRVVFMRNSDATPGRYELWSVERTGGAAPVKLSGTIPPTHGGVAGFAVTPDGTHVLFTADRDVNDAHELYVAPVDGSAAPLELSGTIVFNGDVLTIPLLVTPDCTRVVYVADALVDDRYELFSVLLDGSQPPVALASPAVTFGDVRLGAGAAQLDPSGRRVVFMGDLAVDGRYDLYSVPVAGGPRVLLSGDVPADRDVELGFVPLRNGRDVLFRADLAQNDVLELWLAPLDGSRAPVRRSFLAHALGDVEPDFAVGPDGRHVYYRADAHADGQVELFRFPLLVPVLRPR